MGVRECGRILYSDYLLVIWGLRTQMLNVFGFRFEFDFGLGIGFGFRHMVKFKAKS